MNDENQPAGIWQAIEAGRTKAREQIVHAQAGQRHFADMERKAREELSDLDAAERVIRRLAGQPIEEHDVSAQQAPERVTLMERARQSQQKAMVLEYCVRALSNGSWMSTDELHAGLMQLGVQLTAANPAQRISQILSADERFRTQRGRGWSLHKLGEMEEDRLDSRQRPEGDHLDQQLKTTARRLVNDDRSSS